MAQADIQPSEYEEIAAASWAGSGMPAECTTTSGRPAAATRTVAP